MNKKSKVIWPLIALAAVTFILGILQYWKGDAVLCQFINYIPQGTADDYRLITSWGDIMESQRSFYTTANGRVLLQVLIQAFATMLPQWVFAAVNAVMYSLLALVVMKLSRLSDMRWTNVVLVAAIVFLAFDMDFYDPPFQMSYVWAFTLVGWWMLLYRNHKAVGGIALLLIGILAGATQEALTVGVLGALGLDAMARRFKLSRAQWCGIVGFAIGTIILCAAPGNFHRLGQSATASLMQRLIHIGIHSQLTIFTAIVLAIQLVLHRVSLKQFVTENRMVIYAWCVLLLFNVMLGKCSDRQVLGLEFCSLLLLCNALLKDSALNLRSYRVLSVACGILAVIVSVNRGCRLYAESTACREISAMYAASPDGKVVVSTPTYIHGRGIVNSAGRLMQAERDSADFHPLSLIPEELAGIPMDFSGSKTVNTRYGVTYCVTSVNSPREFYERGRFLNYPLWRKKVAFLAEGEIAGAQWHYAIASGNVEF